MVTVACLAAALAADSFNVHLLPAKMSALITLDFAAIKDAGYWDEEIREVYTEALGRNGPFRRVSETLAVNPETVKTLTFAVAEKTGSGPPKALILINGEFPFEKASKALLAMGDKGELTTLKMHEQPVYFDHNEAKALYFTLLDGETLLLCEDKALMKEALDGLAEARKPAEEVAEWLDFEGKGDAVFRASAILPPEARRGLANVPQFKNLAEKLEQVQIAGFLGAAPRLRLRVKTAGAETATQLKSALDGLMLLAKLAIATNPNERPEAAAILDKLTLRTDNANLEIAGAVDQDFFAKMVKSERQKGREMRKKFKERREQRDREKKEGKNPPAEKKVELKLGG